MLCGMGGLGRSTWDDEGAASAAARTVTLTEIHRVGSGRELLLLQNDALFPAGKKSIFLWIS